MTATSTPAAAPRSLRELPRVALITGVVCVAIGLVGVVLGAGAVGGAGYAPADSNERFAGGLLAAYGGLWIVAGRRTPVEPRTLSALALVLLAGAAGRVISLLVTGWPQWFQTVQIVVELVVPVVVLALVRAAREPTPRDP